MRKTFNEHVSVHTHIRLLKSAHFALHSTEKKFHFLNFFSSVYPYTPTSTCWTWLIFTTRFAEYYIRYPPKKNQFLIFFSTYTSTMVWYHTIPNTEQLQYLPYLLYGMVPYLSQQNRPTIPTYLPPHVLCPSVVIKISGPEIFFHPHSKEAGDEKRSPTL